VIVFVEQFYDVDFYGYNFSDNNIVKLLLKINNMPIILLYTYRSLSVDSINFTNSLKEAFVRLNCETGVIALIRDMNINIICGHTNCNNNFLEFLSQF